MKKKQKQTRAIGTFFQFFIFLKPMLLFQTGEVYKWISNWRLVYTNWAAEEPREKIACVYLDRDGHWKTGNCSETHFSICEQYHGTGV